MWSRFVHISFALLLWCLSLFISGCLSDEPNAPSDHIDGANEMVVYETDSTEWHVCIIAKHLIYENAVQVALQEPWQLPNREDAQVLRIITYPNEERFVTSDGYTFGMPSASVSKAGTKTKYSVLGLWKRRKTIEVPF